MDKARAPATLATTCNLARLHASPCGSRGAEELNVTEPGERGPMPPQTGGSLKDGARAASPSSAGQDPSSGSGPARQTGDTPVAGRGSPGQIHAHDGAAPAHKKRRRKRRNKGRTAPASASNRPISGARPLHGPAALTAAPSKPVQAERTAQPAVKPDEGAIARANGAAQPVNGHKPAFANPYLVRKKRGPLYAALDLGTNNCRLLIATPAAPGQFRVVDAFSRIVRLGEGLSQTGRLSQPAMDRALDALRICAAKLKQRDIRRFRLIATEACRSAENGAEFLQRVKAETGLVLEIVDRETEARLAVCGCGSLVERETESLVLFDIGGGSSEIALVDFKGRRTNRLSDHIAAWTSLPVGVVSLAERFGGRHVSQEVFDAMIADVGAHIETFADRGLLGDQASSDQFHLLGTSGTVTTLAGIFLKLERYDRRKVDGIWLSDMEVTAMTEQLLSWDFEMRVANPCIGPDRADLVLAGCAILEAIRRTWPSQRLRVADRGLREGILTELMARDGAWRSRRRRPWRQ